MINFLLCFVVLATIGFGLAWGVVHSTIAYECDKQGSFYVGDKVYECKRKE